MPSVLKSLQFSFPVPLKMNLSQCGRRIHSSKHCVPVHTERVAISIPVQFWGSMYSSERSQSPSTPEIDEKKLNKGRVVIFLNRLLNLFCLRVSLLSFTM